MISESIILKHIARQTKKAAGFKQLVRELGLHGDERRELDSLLQKMVARGTLLSDSDRYALPAPSSDKNLMAGRLSMHRDGFGFVIPDAKSLSPALKARLTGDIFIAPHVVGNAMHGDLVLVDIINVRPDGRAEGRIVRPVMRAHPTVVGIFHYGSRGGYVRPIDSKITQEILIPAGMERPGASTASPGNDESKSQTQRTRGTQRKTQSVDRVLGDEVARADDWDDL
ncbi:MAG TPA: hypothetical protein VK812_18745, partial [Candidatus Binatus sp.]|nr:hypothetical protein [Candidatus Binatus sp.]